MASELLLHDQTRANLDRFLAAPRHGLLIIGPHGAGKPTLAQIIIASLLKVPPTKLAHQPYFRHLQPSKGTISIDAVRNIQDFLRLKSPGRQTWRRAILIEDAGSLTTEAQNALLKILEEPPQDTVIILTASGRSLLPTITSRLQQLVVRAPTQLQSQTYFSQQGHPPSAITKAYHLSKGQAGLMTSLLTDQQAHPLNQQIGLAKQLLAQTSFERLVQVDKLVKQKIDLPSLLWAMQRVADAALAQAAHKQNSKQVRYWQTLLTEVLAAQQNLASHPQPKLLLTNLALSM